MADFSIKILHKFCGMFLRLNKSEVLKFEFGVDFYSFDSCTYNNRNRT